MRLCASVSAAVVARFLRPRGDAPDGEAAERRAARVPPPTRRCAPPATSERGRDRGSSAHAEMRLAIRGPRGAAAGFLRPRGDAPSSYSLRLARAAVPPPTRRCAPSGLDSEWHAAGSSAHAEMRPCECSSPRASCRFLRPRGDAPPARLRPPCPPRVPPPTRRCALARQGTVLAERGSSAHAEMRPSRSDSVCCALRFLRPRGDAPLTHPHGADLLEVPPPTRRCARVDGSRGMDVYGSSAHAEMRPHPHGGSVRGSRVPPPTRRCALTSTSPHGTRLGSSAHAEMRP